MNILPTVRFSIDQEEHAGELTDMLWALGFTPVRIMAIDDMLGWSLVRFARSYKLTEREAAVAELMLREQASYGTIAVKLELSMRTVKWLAHSVFTKTDVANREELLRLVLGLPIASQRKREDAAASEV